MTCSWIDYSKWRGRVGFNFYWFWINAPKLDLLSIASARFSAQRLSSAGQETKESAHTSSSAASPRHLAPATATGLVRHCSELPAAVQQIHVALKLVRLQWLLLLVLPPGELVAPPKPVE